MGNDTIRIRSFWYTDEDGLRKNAYRGESPKLSKEDRERGERLDAFGDPPEVGPPGSAEVSEDAPPNVGEMSDSDIEEWLTEEKPTAKEVVAAAGGDAQLADRLLDAESAVTGGKPRKTVQEPLEALISAGDAE